jgi:hypothetical protein
MSTSEIGDGEAAALIAGEALLARDDIPDANQKTRCFSCSEILIGLHCHACGQKNDNYRRSIFVLIWEVFASIFSLESRIWRTWLKLLTRPGRVARDFADGKRTLWTSPVRAYLGISIVLFSYISITNTQIFSLFMDVERRATAPADLSELKPSDLNIDVKLLMFETTKSLERRREGTNTELVDFLLEYPVPLTLQFKDGDLQLKEIDADAPDDSPNIEINGEIVPLETASDQGRSAIKLMLARPDLFNAVIAKYLPRIMLGMMPFAMLIGALFIRGRENAMLYDHLVHAAYIHAVYFFLLLVSLITAQLTPVPPSVIIGLQSLYLIIYLPMSLRGMFSRGMIKTFWTSYTVGFIYLIVMFILLAGLTIIAGMNVVEQSQLFS